MSYSATNPSIPSQISPLPAQPHDVSATRDTEPGSKKAPIGASLPFQPPQPASLSNSSQPPQFSPNCALCGVCACRQFPDREEALAAAPPFCPMDLGPVYQEALAIVESPKYRDFYRASAQIEQEGYAQWPRVREILELIKKMSYTKIGLAFCGGFREEARLLVKLFQKHQVQLISVMCKTGACDKTEVGILEEEKLKPGHFEPMCNPVAQALLLNQAGTELNIVMGLCVGHDSLFYKFSQAPCTTLAVKDRVTGHNPLAPLYYQDGYFADRLK